LRIDRAIQELRSTDKRLADIAGDAGFSDQSHFCRTFKLSTGLTPGQYRKSVRRG
jgi:AraC-like DNA-binding protein